MISKVQFDKKKTNRIRLSKGDLLTQIICLLLCSIALVVFLYPLLYVLFASFVSEGTLSLKGYLVLLNNKLVVKGLWNSILYSVVGTIITVLLTVFSAFALTRKKSRSSGIIEMLIFYIPFHVSGGIIATYIVVHKLGLINTMWALILPFAIGYRSLRDLKAVFENSLSADICKAATLDGCGAMRYLFSIALPLMLPSVALIAFRYFVGYWSNYFYAQLFITDRNKFPLSMVLNELLVKNQATDILTNATADGIHTVQMAQYALIVISSLPILLVFIMIQKKLREIHNKGRRR